MSGLIIFLHGYRGGTGDWGTVPILIKRSLKSFEVVTLQYSASTFSRADIERSAGRVLSEIQRDYSAHDPIYLVGYSMGSIIAREVCLKLLQGNPSDDALLDKIAAVITVGAPLGATRFAPLARTFGRISVKVGRVTDPKFVFGRYSDAIKAAAGRPVRRPKQIHIEIEDDEVVAAHDAGLFTSDDQAGGVVRGTHRTFVQDAATALAVADELLKNIRNQQNSFPKPYISTDRGENRALPDVLSLIACSNRKASDGNADFSGPEPGISLPSVALRERVLSKRSKMFSLIKDAKIFSGFERGGNRAHQAPNKTLVHGLDLGGVMRGGSYMPAFQRYTGRTYGPISAEAWESYVAHRDRMTVMIMSGLYGLFDAIEWIQEYDIHLTDTDATGSSVSSMWSELFTDVLIEYVNRAYNGGKVKIFNLLGDKDYVAAIQWHRLPKECSVYHLASPTLSHKALLPSCGAVLNDLLLHPDRITALQRDQRYPLSDFGPPPAGESEVEILFEPRFGSSQQ